MQYLYNVGLKTDLKTNEKKIFICKCLLQIYELNEYPIKKIFLEFNICVIQWLFETMLNFMVT